MANVDRPWSSALEITGILLDLLEFSAVLIRAAVAVCICLYNAALRFAQHPRSGFAFILDRRRKTCMVISGWRYPPCLPTYILHWRPRRGFAGGKRNSGAAPPNGLAVQRIAFSITVLDILPFPLSDNGIPGATPQVAYDES
jgi:hypothetical protein